MIKVYEYGLLQPTLNADKAREQLRLAHRYYNALIEIERSRRATILEAQKAHCPRLLEIETEIEASLEDKARLKTLKAERSALKKAANKDPVLKAKYEAIEEEHHERARAARANRGDLFWGTYLQIEQAVDAARKAQKKGDIRFRRWTGDGILAVQCQHGLLVERLDRDTRVQIDPPPPVEEGASRRKQLRRRTTMRLRVGSEGRKPIWVEWPILLHRPLPEGAKITWAKVVARRAHPWTRWVLQLTIEMPDPVQTTKDGVIGIDIGWRKLGDRVRVARWADSAGRNGDLEIPPSIVARLAKADAIRSRRDRLQDRIRPVLAARVPSVVGLPEKWEKSVQHIAKWKSPSRFVGLLDALRKIEGTERLVKLLDRWRRRDLHLWQYESGLREGALRHRRDIYRCFAAFVAKTYGRIVLEDIDMRKFAEQPGPKDVTTPQPIAHQRFGAAISQLRGCIGNAIASSGGITDRKDPAFTSRDCVKCRAVFAGDLAGSLHYRCNGCGHVWDQDLLAALNLLASADVPTKEPGSLASDKPAKRAAKFAKRHKPKLAAIGETADRSQLVAVAR